MIVFAYITVRNRGEAQRLARHLMEKKLAACVNIIEGMESMYPWKGKIEHASETILIAKTEKKLSKKIILAVKEVHSYEVPCILFLPVISGNKDYIKWLTGLLK